MLQVGAVLLYLLCTLPEQHTVPSSSYLAYAAPNTPNTGARSSRLLPKVTPGAAAGGNSPPTVQIWLIKQFVQTLWKYAGNKEFMRLIINGNLAGQMAAALGATNAITLLLPDPAKCKQRLGPTSPYARNNKSLELIMGFHIITGSQLSYENIQAAKRVAKVRADDVSATH